MHELGITQDIYTMEARAQVREGTQERFNENVETVLRAYIARN